MFYVNGYERLSYLGSIFPAHAVPCQVNMSTVSLLMYVICGSALCCVLHSTHVVPAGPLGPYGGRPFLCPADGWRAACHSLVGRL